MSQLTLRKEGLETEMGGVTPKTRRDDLPTYWRLDRVASIPSSGAARPVVKRSNCSPLSLTLHLVIWSIDLLEWLKSASFKSEFARTRPSAVDPEFTRI
jgi:hypothetical protein